MAVARGWVHAINTHDAARIAVLLTEDAVAEEVAEGHPVRGREAIAKAYREVFRGYPDCTATILNKVVDTNQVVLEVSFRGTNKGEFRGTPATDKSINLRIAYFLKFRRGKISAVTEYYDAATIASQQGLS